VRLRKQLGGAGISGNATGDLPGTIQLTSAVEQDGAPAEAALEDGHDFRERLAAGKALATAQQDEVAEAAGRRLDDGIKSAFLGVAEDGEESRAVTLVDGIVAPLAARDLAAVKAKQLVELDSAEKNRPRPAPIIVQAENCRHRSCREIVGHAAVRPAVFPISCGRSSAKPASRRRLAVVYLGPAEGVW
jgi:hypothetical protein